MLSAFGIEHGGIAKGVRPDRAIDVAIAAGRKAKAVKLKPVKTPLADARYGPRIEKSAFGVSHAGQVAKVNRDRVKDAGLVAGGTAAGGVGGNAANRVRVKGARRRATTAARSGESHFQAASSKAGVDSQFHHIAAMEHHREFKSALSRATSRPRRAAAIAAGAAIGGTAATALRRRKVEKSAFGVVHKGPMGAVDDVALAPGKVKAVTGTVRPGVAVPAPAPSPRKPLTQKLNAAVAATGGSQN